MRSKHKVSLLILLVGCAIFFSETAFAQSSDESKSQIYSQLKCCACQVSFDKCTCLEAKEMKAYIDALLESGARKEEVFYKVAKKYSLNAILDTQIKQEIEKRLIREAGQSRPQIVLDPSSFDFGVMSKKKGRVSKTFKISNKGNAPLIIKQIKSSCPCATVSLKVDKNKSPYFGTEGSPKDWQSEIKPRKSGELELVVDLASAYVKTGKLIRDASLVSNDPLYPEVSLRVEAEVADVEEPYAKGPELSGRIEDGIRVIEVKASRYKFKPDPIVVSLGEKVRLVVTSADVAHGIVIPEFSVNLSIPAGKTESVEFVAERKGTFHAHCSVYCGPGHAHMHASLIVKE